MNNKVEITGKCTHVGAVETVGSKGFIKRTFVLTDDSGKFPTMVAFLLKKDRTDLVSEDYVGCELKVSGFIESREWGGKYFTDITAISVAKVGEKATPASVTDNNPEDVDDMPF